VDVFPSDKALGIPATFAPMRPRMPQQCLLLADKALLTANRGMQLWLDALYVRLTKPRGDDVFEEFVMASDPETKLFMTRVTLQGNGNGRVRTCAECGVETSRTAAVYAEGVMHVSDALSSFIGPKLLWSIILQKCMYEGKNALYYILHTAITELFQAIVGGGWVIFGRSECTSDCDDVQIV
jgi:hypothetical protein